LAKYHFVERQTLAIPPDLKTSAKVQRGAHTRYLALEDPSTLLP
jgi:hypothetical protein